MADKSELSGGGCAKPDWVGDEFCDDFTNNPECTYDGGDCCRPDVDTKYCQECQCFNYWVGGNWIIWAETAWDFNVYIVIWFKNSDSKGSFMTIKIDAFYVSSSLGLKWYTKNGVFYCALYKIIW